MSSSQDPNTILVEKHYIPVDVYMQLYPRTENTPPVTTATSNPSRYVYAPSSAESTQARTWYSAENAQPRNRYSTDSTQRPSSSTSRNTDRTNDLLSFFNLQPTRNTEPLTSRFFTRTYDSSTSTDADSSFVNLLMTTFLTAPNSTYSSSSRITPLLLEANSRIFTYNGNIDLDSGICSICTQEWQHGEELRKLSACRHYFHKSCVDTWLNDHTTCPLCRTNIVCSSSSNNTATYNTNTGTGINEVD
jgi:hypothetical protein